MRQDDIILAQKIVSNSTTNVRYDKTAYHSSSFIYRKTNEKIQKYQEYLKNKENILSVIASGNQIFNSIYEGSKNISAFDISVFPRYYLFLQIAAMECLNKDEFCEFFYNDLKPNDFYDDIYSLIRNNLDYKEQEFWDCLFNFFDWNDIYNSTLFSSEAVYLNEVKEQNKYLQTDEDFNKLKEQLKNVNFNFYTGDISLLVNDFKDKFDFINLSSIVYYKELEEYKKLLKSLPLNDNGQILTYLYRIDEWIINDLDIGNCSFDKFNNDNCSVMIYTKK